MQKGVLVIVWLGMSLSLVKCEEESNGLESRSTANANQIAIQNLIAMSVNYGCCGCHSDCNHPPKPHCEDACLCPKVDCDKGYSEETLKCSNGFEKVGYKCYHMYSHTKDGMVYTDAVKYCENLNGKLAKFEDANTFQKAIRFIESVIPKPSAVEVWVSATDIAKEGEWLWHDGCKVPPRRPFWGDLFGIIEPAVTTANNCCALHGRDAWLMHDVPCGKWKWTVKFRPLCEAVAYC